MKKRKFVQPPTEKDFYYGCNFSLAVPLSKALYDCLEEVIEIDGKKVRKEDVDWSKEENRTRLASLVDSDYLYSKYGEKHYRISVKSWNDFQNAEVYYDEKFQCNVNDLEWYEISEMLDELRHHSDCELKYYDLEFGISEKQIVSKRHLDYFYIADSLYVVNQEDNVLYTEKEFRAYLEELRQEHPFVAGKYLGLTLHKMKNIDNDYKLFKMNFADSGFSEDEFFIHTPSCTVLNKDKQSIDKCVIGDKSLSELVLADYRACLVNKLDSDVLNHFIEKHSEKTLSKKNSRIRNKI
ncbi:hypothetical protein KW496_19470 [Vibrio fluvialis]|nr:hypothetical protein [Vibrio fluvialis]